jgi:hypothetical protein
MTSNVSEVCGETADECVCGLVPVHDGQPHLCERCSGSWVGVFDTDSFDVVAWPQAVRKR